MRLSIFSMNMTILNMRLNKMILIFVYVSLAQLIWTIHNICKVWTPATIKNDPFYLYLYPSINVNKKLFREKN